MSGKQETANCKQQPANCKLQTENRKLQTANCKLQTKQMFAVIGHPVAHSLSPRMHMANFAAIGYDGRYEKFDVAPEELAKFVLARRDEGYRGLNVTVPHKVAVIPLLDHVDDSVSLYGACNTLRFEQDGTISGFNTDVIGFMDCLANHGFGIEGKCVIIMGCGGAGAPLAKSCVLSRASKVLVAARHEESAIRLRDSLRSVADAGRTEVGIFDVSDIATARSADLIVNATPVGLKPDDPSILPETAFRPGQFVLDIIPTQHFPPTAAAARRAGATAVDGLEFLVGQGAKAFEIWTDIRADRDAMLAALRDLRS